MVVCLKTLCGRRAKSRGLRLLALLAVSVALIPASRGQSQAPEWQVQVRKFAEAKEC
jgi:hypothetical protein